MVRNIVVLGGNSHPKFVDNLCEFLGIAPCNRVLSKFEVGESRCEIKDSVRGKDVYIIQSFGCGTDGSTVNDHFLDLCIMISACKTGSAKRITAVLPLFPYSRQPDLPYYKAGAPLSKPSGSAAKQNYTFESVPATPGPNIPTTAGIATNDFDITRMMSKTSLTNGSSSSQPRPNGDDYFGKPNDSSLGHRSQGSYTTHDYENQSMVTAFQAKPGYKQWVAQAGTLVADLLTCSGADRVLTCDLHESTYQGFFDIPGWSSLSIFFGPHGGMPWGLGATTADRRFGQSTTSTQNRYSSGISSKTYQTTGTQ
jgi:ribose-phosphate pyrophosphokinase